MTCEWGRLSHEELVRCGHIVDGEWMRLEDRLDDLGVPVHDLALVLPTKTEMEMVCRQ